MINDLSKVKFSILISEAVSCNQCSKTQKCLPDLMTNQAKCVICNYKCPRKRRPATVSLFYCLLVDIGEKKKKHSNEPQNRQLIINSFLLRKVAKRVLFVSLGRANRVRVETTVIIIVPLLPASSRNRKENKIIKISFLLFLRFLTLQTDNLFIKII